LAKIERVIEGVKLTIESGIVAKQAHGAVWVTYGDTVVLVTAVGSLDEKEECDFFPLTVEYQERAYAAGKIPGGFIKREGRPSDKEILGARLIDRPIRPLFPKDFRMPVQIVSMVLSADEKDIADVLGLIGASSSLLISCLPFTKPVGAVRLTRIGDRFIVNPTYQQLEEGQFDFVIAATKEAIVMIEGEAKEIPEDLLMEAIDFSEPYIKQIIEMQEELMSQIGVEKIQVVPKEIPQELEAKVRELATDEVRDAIFIPEKKERQDKIKNIVDSLVQQLQEEFPESESVINEVVEKIAKEIMRGAIMEEKRRADNRSLDELRSITCEVGILPRTHGSALFTRGQTQSLAIVTLGTSEDEQIIDDIEGRISKRFMVHYNFPPFSTGEVKSIRGPGRREIGHGNLAERSLNWIIPSKEEFPYTVRIVSDILESNGSTSMATVCGGSLSLMDAGVPIKKPVAGISIGLVKEGDQWNLLTDITGLEDAFGDMDFKVAGTRDGITGIQVDIKIDGLSKEIIRAAIEKAKQARMIILDKMESVISKPRSHISVYAPKIVTFNIPPEKIRDVIGPGGKSIRSIIETTGVKIDINDDGKLIIAGEDEKSAIQAKEMINYLIAEAEVGKCYLGKVLRIVSFGAFVEILPGKEGLLHISEIADHRINRVEDYLQEGDEVLVKVVSIDDWGRINLSRKAALRDSSAQKEKEKIKRYSRLKHQRVMRH
jgi:polyribonucleotide nucleotidyltransferase